MIHNCIQCAHKIKGGPPRNEFEFWCPVHKGGFSKTVKDTNCEEWKSIPEYIKKWRKRLV